MSGRGRAGKPQGRGSIVHNLVREGQEYNPEEAKDEGQCLSTLVMRLDPLALLSTPQKESQEPV